MRKIIKALKDVKKDRALRMGVPGKWRVYKNDTGSTILEIFPRKEKQP